MPTRWAHILALTGFPSLRLCAFALGLSLNVLLFSILSVFFSVLNAGSELRGPTAVPQSDVRNRAATYIPKLEKILKENIASFWYTKSLDHRNGGYVINFGPHGESKGGGTKMIVTQARTVWLFSRMARAGYGGKEYLDAAEWGYRFLKEKMWDAKNGGFYWEVDATGDKKLKPRKHLYGQSFGLYALSEYYLASKNKEALDFAIRLFNLLEAKSHDQTYGGYIEFFNEDWTTPPREEQSYMGSQQPGFKLMNTHLHLLEAMTTFYRASKLPLARERLLELINIESNAVVRKKLGACTDKYLRDWTPRLEGNFARVSYGHDIENVWLLIDASNAADISNTPFLDLYHALFDYSLRYGYDTQQGGFYDSGPFNEPADNRNKTWWVEAEALASSLHMYRLTRDPKYFSVFEKTFDFVDKYMVDWQNGEWHATITPEGKAAGDKAHIWKAGYHNGRAMIECLEIFKSLR
ncbi:MAG TPA: AGE family epimerase/isomerase [Acidobacteriota bacterium]|nr:AGE family epimerase/isomerase [Acidobacteriota bacterium]